MEYKQAHCPGIQGMVYRHGVGWVGEVQYTGEGIQYRHPCQVEGQVAPPSSSTWAWASAQAGRLGQAGRRKTCLKTGKKACWQAEELGQGHCSLWALSGPSMPFLLLPTLSHPPPPPSLLPSQVQSLSSHGWGKKEKFHRAGWGWHGVMGYTCLLFYLFCLA